MEQSWLDIIYQWCLWFWVVVPLPTFFIVLRSTAAYGKFSSKNPGQVINGNLAWAIQESFGWSVFLLTFWTVSDTRNSAINFLHYLLISMWVIHFFNRAYIYTWRNPAIKATPLYLFVTTICFVSLNAFVNGYALAITSTFPLLPTTTIGVLLFFVGFFGNIVSDNTLMNLRRGKGKDKSQYYIPNGGLYELISCPNYLFEIVEWTGYAIASGFTAAASSFAVMTVANLVPRALATHKWYLDHFKEEYPKSRKAIIPFIL